jgi:hypothetical protein
MYHANYNKKANYLNLVIFSSDIIVIGGTKAHLTVKEAESVLREITKYYTPSEGISLRVVKRNIRVVISRR